MLAPASGDRSPLTRAVKGPGTARGEPARRANQLASRKTTGTGDRRDHRPRDSGAATALVAQGRLMALPIPLGASPPAGHAVYAERLDLRIAIPFTDVLEIVLRRRFDLLVQRLVIIEGRRDSARNRDMGAPPAGKSGT